MRAGTRQATFIDPEQPRQLLAVGVPFDRVGHVFDQRQHLGSDLRFLFGVLQIAFGSQRFHHVQHDRAGGVQQVFPVCRIFHEDLIRVFAGG